VYSLKGQLDRRLGLNLALKQTTGPLGKKGGRLCKSGRMKRRKLRKHRLTQSHKSVAVGQEGGPSSRDMSTLYQKKMTDQRQELKDIEGLNLVANRSTREAISHHLASHATRLSNRRLTILDSNSKTIGRQTVYKKSSVLVTSVEQDEQVVRELQRQQSRAFIESIIQCSSRQQRVLEKLSSEEMTNISAAEVMKKKKRKSWMGMESKEETEEEHELQVSSQAQQVLKKINSGPLPKASALKEKERWSEDKEKDGDFSLKRVSGV